MTAQLKWYLSKRLNAQPDVICLKMALANRPQHSNKMLDRSGRGRWSFCQDWDSSQCDSGYGEESKIKRHS